MVPVFPKRFPVPGHKKQQGLAEASRALRLRYDPEACKLHILPGISVLEIQ